MQLKMSSAKWWPFCSGWKVLEDRFCILSVFEWPQGTAPVDWLWCKLHHAWGSLMRCQRVLMTWCQPGTGQLMIMNIIIPRDLQSSTGLYILSLTTTTTRGGSDKTADGRGGWVPPVVPVRLLPWKKEWDCLIFIMLVRWHIFIETVFKIKKNRSQISYKMRSGFLLQPKWYVDCLVETGMCFCEAVVSAKCSVHSTEAL